jgi:heat shock protein HspQ
MLETSQLPFLLRLLDDDDPTVRAQVLDALAAFGPHLRAELASLSEPPEPATVAYVQGLVVRHLRGRYPEAQEEGMAFRPGQVVRHRRYGYRGVVVDADPACEADETWYHGHEPQPDRDQPWYHVLVHNSMQVTYAAQSSLETDDSGDEVIHPYVPYFFTEFQDGEYVRNDQPWPS